MTAVNIPTTMFELASNGIDLTGDMAELDHAGLDPLGVLYPESGERGFQLKSDTTGETIDFVHIDTAVNADGEIMYWEFTPCVADKLFTPALRDCSLVIFND